jgi:hypothetical protein
MCKNKQHGEIIQKNKKDDNFESLNLKLLDSKEEC